MSEPTWAERHGWAPGSRRDEWNDWPQKPPVVITLPHEVHEKHGVIDWIDIYGEALHVSLQQRPAYCDRGHWVSVIGYKDGITPDQEHAVNLDPADALSRYYMDLQRAVLEIEDFIRWRERQSGLTAEPKVGFGR